MKKESGNRRQANFELLRILAMLMIVCLHYLSRAGALTQAQTAASGMQKIGNLAEALCIPAVNAYVLITGYFLSASHLRLRRIAALLAEIWFYTLLIPPALKLLGIPLSGNDAWTVWSWLFPVSMESYWFMTAYVLLCLLAPFLNAGLRTLTKRQLGILIGMLLVFYSVLPSLSPVRMTTDRFGYDFGWFIVLYLTAGYLRRFGSGLLENPRFAATLYFAGAGGIWLLSLLLHDIAWKKGALLYYADVPFHYNFVLCLAAAVGLFSWFGALRIPEGRATVWIRRIAPLTLGVYLIHENREIRDRWLPTLTKFAGPVPENALFLLHMAACVVLLFVCCLFVDWVRSVLFDYAGRLLAASGAEERIRRRMGDEDHHAGET